MPLHQQWLLGAFVLVACPVTSKGQRAHPGDAMGDDEMLDSTEDLYLYTRTVKREDAVITAPVE